MASNSEHREHRARLLEAILDRLDFSHRQRGEFIQARLAKYSLERMAQCLAILGKLTFYVKQLDKLLFSDSIVDWYVKDFVQEHVEK